jgi:hypothetical protein
MRLFRPNAPHQRLQGIFWETLADIESMTGEIKKNGRQHYLAKET